MNEQIDTIEIDGVQVKISELPPVAQKLVDEIITINDELDYHQISILKLNGARQAITAQIAAMVPKKEEE